MKNRILIVEDDHAISDAVALNMQFVGYGYAVFDDGKKAADSLADDHAFDLALLDIMLPGIDGFELFSYMEKYNIPVIYMTAKTDSASEIKGLMDGAEDYIVKPFDVLTLMVRIEKVLKRTGRLNTVYRVRDIELNSETRVVTKAGRAVELQPLEFDVLLTLLKNKNLTVSREQLLSDVWGYEYAGETRAVDMKISNLRKKLNLGDAIRAIPKLGYRLEERCNEAVAKNLSHLYRRAARHRHGLFLCTSHPFQKQHIGAYLQLCKGQTEKPCLLFFGNGGLLYCGE